MKPDLKALGLALLATFAMSATTASVARAAEDKFHVHPNAKTLDIAFTATADPLDPTQDFFFTEVEGLSVSCEAIEVRGATLKPESHKPAEKTSVTSEEITAGLEFENCEGLFGEALEADTEGCHFLITSDTSSGHGPLHIVCDEERALKLTDSIGCKITIGSQTPEGGVVYDEPSGTTDKTMTAEATVTDIEYTASFICQLGGVPASGNDLDYLGKFTVEAFERTGGTITNPEHTSEALPIWHGPTE